MLAEERTFAESGAGLLKTYGRDHQAALIEGQKLYAEGKAKFDGLIEQLLLDLAEDRNPEDPGPWRRLGGQHLGRGRLAVAAYGDGTIR